MDTRTLVLGAIALSVIIGMAFGNLNSGWWIFLAVLIVLCL